MKNKLLLLFIIICTCLSANAQIKIDFSNGTGNNAYCADGYTEWYLSSEITGSKSESKEIDGVTIKISHGDNTQGEKITRTWYKSGMTTDESYLINDGIFSCLSEDDSSIGDGAYGATNERVEIDVTFSGLSVGTYSLMAYHNYTFNAGHTLPTIGVEVNGVVMQTGIVQSQQKLTLTEAAYSLVQFDVTAEGEDVVVTYFSEPVSGTNYTRTYFLINSLELGTSVVGSDNKVQNAYPSNLDYHVDADDGSVMLEWAVPTNGADSYAVYMGTDEDAVANGTAGSTTVTATSLSKTGLSPLNRYYWRVDVVRDGVTYEGDVWSFQPRRLAFPGADGAGKYAVGGRGYNGNGKVYHVTKLTEDRKSVV